MRMSILSTRFTTAMAVTSTTASQQISFSTIQGPIYKRSGMKVSGSISIESATPTRRKEEEPSTTPVRRASTGLRPSSLSFMPSWLVMPLDPSTPVLSTSSIASTSTECSSTPTAPTPRILHRREPTPTPSGPTLPPPTWLRCSTTRTEMSSLKNCPTTVPCSAATISAPLRDC